MQVAMDVVIPQKHLDVHVENGRRQPGQFWEVPGQTRLVLGCLCAAMGAILGGRFRVQSLGFRVLSQNCCCNSASVSDEFG
jgi:hypothetical protein